MGILCVLFLLGVLAAAACGLTKESGAAIRRGDEKAKEKYGGNQDGKDQSG